jgi:hypothetical protein
MEKEIAAVDLDDLKTVWAIQHELQGGSIDEEIFRQVCKPKANVRAAAFRASVLILLVQTAPERLAEFIHEGQPCDALFNAIATVPITLGAPIQASELLEHVRRFQQ